jgi:hypothetical protein
MLEDKKDDWRSEVKNVLERDKIFQILKEKCIDDSSGSHVLSLVDDATYFAYERSKTVIRHMGEFTLHDGDHLFRVLYLMGKILPENDIRKLTVPELMLLIISAFFHDLGMAPEENEVVSWKKIWNHTPQFESEEEKINFGNFQRFCFGQEERMKQIEVLINCGNITLADTLKGYLITDFIRLTHGERIYEIIKKYWNEKIVYKNSDLTSELASICSSHNKDAFELLELEKDYICGEGIFVCFPLIGILLRLADILDFDAKRTPNILFSHLNVKHPVSIREWNIHRSVHSWSIEDKEIIFSAKCNHPAIELCIHDFCDIIDQELVFSASVISELKKNDSFSKRQIALKLPPRVNRSKIQSKQDLFGKPEYKFSKTKFELNKKQVIGLLMGSKLYGDPEVCLRELVQNSIDACLLRQAMERKWGNTYEPCISIKYYKEEGEDIIEVDDNGIGMDYETINKYYSKVGSSFYKSSDFYTLKAESGAKFTPTSRFGIGILSCFMVADSILVDTRKVYDVYQSSDPLDIIIEGEDSIFWIKTGKRKKPGTTTKLVLRKNNHPWQKSSAVEFFKSIEKVIPNPPFLISTEFNSEQKNRNEKSFLELSAHSLKDYYWKLHENIREVVVNINQPEIGLIGSAIIGILEIHDKPVKKIEVTSNEINLNGGIFPLKKILDLRGDSIYLNTTSITLGNERELKSESIDMRLLTSKSSISFHGIEVPASLFPYSWDRQKQQVHLSWPFPMLILLDICSNIDVDLNSARTYFLNNEKWAALEEQLAFVICEEIAKSVTREYWFMLRSIYMESKNANFLKGIERVNISDHPLELNKSFSFDKSLEEKTNPF